MVVSRLNLFSYYRLNDNLYFLCNCRRVYFVDLVYTTFSAKVNTSRARVQLFYTSTNVRQESQMKDTEWKRNGDDDQVCMVGQKGVENDAGVKESRVSRVTIRFGTAVVSAGSWALSICNSLYGVRDVCTWLYCNGHGNATRTISNYMAADGKRSARGGRITRIVETLTYFVFSPPLSSHPSDVPFARVRWKFKHLVPRLFAGEWYSEGRGEWNFHLT